MGATKVRGEEGLLAIFLHIQLFFHSYCVILYILHDFPLSPPPICYAPTLLLLFLV